MRRVLAAGAAALAAGAACAADEAPVRGTYAEGKSGFAWIVPCGSGKRLELEDSAAARELRALFARLGAGRARNLHVEVAGRREGDAFRADAVLRAQTGGLGCSEDLRRVVAKAGGNNPSWSMVFDDAALRFQRVGDRAPAVFPPLGLKRTADRFEFRAETESARVDIVLLKEPCEDPLANAVFAYRAEISFGWRAEAQSGVYRGCAYLGDAAR